jgi:hypothetical protein
VKSRFIKRGDGVLKPLLKKKAGMPITAYNPGEPPGIKGRKLTAPGESAAMQKTLKYSGIIPITTS